MEKILGKKIKRRDFGKSAIIGMLVIATVGFPNVLRSAEKYRFKFAPLEPAHSLYNKIHHFWWCDRVEELSGGAVKFERYPGGILVKGPDLYEACRDGVIESGTFQAAYEAGTLPLGAVRELPFLFVDIDTTHLMYRKFMEAGLNDYFHSHGIHILSDMIMMPFSFWSTKKWGPIKRLEDLKGCKIRAPGGVISEGVKAMGGVAISIPISEGYTALERGTVDCITTQDPSLIAYRMHEVAKFITRARWIAPSMPIMINLKTWNSLPKDIQNIMSQAGEEAYLNLNRELAKYIKEVLDPTVLKAGMEIVPLPESERARMKKACAPVYDEWLSKNGDVYNGLGRKLFDIVVQTVGRP